VRTLAPMRQYFLDIKAAEYLIKDEEGSELPSLEAARGKALQIARELLAAAIKAGRESDVEAVIVTDDQGRELDQVHLAAVIPQNLRERLRWEIFR
jgi:hypothetical protein